MIDKKLSLRYAKALLGLCEKKEIDSDKILEDLREIDSFLMDNPDVFEYLSAHVIPYKNKEKIISQLCDDEFLYNFVKYVVLKGRFRLFHEIVETFEELSDEKKGRVKAFVKSAVELDEQTKEKLKKQFNEKLNKDVQFDFAEDSSLIAGIVVQVKDVVYDGSLRTYLSNLEHKLMRLSI